MTDPEITISPEELKNLQAFRTQKALLETEAEMAALRARNATLEAQIVLQSIYFKYNLSVDDKIDESTGKIISQPKVTDSEKKE